MYEVIIVGGGHAGCEACLATAKKGHKTLLITGNIKNIADMPCNPSIGGSAKGIVVREIDALGGVMGKVADKANIQIKMLNSSKGPAVRSLRAQEDKIEYSKEMINILKKQDNLTILEGIVEDLIVVDKEVRGIELEDGEKIYSKKVILTTGTYLKSDILVGDERTRKGPHGEKPSNYLSDKLKEYGFRIIRLKTGTPPRLEKSSIDFSKTKLEEGDKYPWTFSFDNKYEKNVELEVPCHLVYTNKNTHKIIADNLNKSSMYGGYATGIGPRYCPSIEDKVVRFKDKERHQLFLEPESLYYDDIYLQGFSTSMPRDIQEKMIRSIEGLENVNILKYAYAIEYDAIYPTQINLSLESKILKNLYTAGQINGTSGYEEAAGQGLIAGINAALSIEEKDPLILKRSDSYIGVLIDDLVTKGTMEPYRLLTSRAEFKLILRGDNADLRLRNFGYEVGLINQIQKEKLDKKISEIKEVENLLINYRITPLSRINDYLISSGSTPLLTGINLMELLKRTEININNIKHFIEINYDDDVCYQVEINAKYNGYIEKTRKEIEKLIKNEEKQIPDDIDYDKVPNLATEARQKLKEIHPINLGQASRISGVNPSDISILMIYLKSRGKYE